MAGAAHPSMLRSDVELHVEKLMLFRVASAQSISGRKPKVV